MALTQLYTAVANDVITSARWNNEFGNIYNNGTDVAFPLTEAVSFAGYTITLDASSVTTFISSASIAYSFTPGAKSGTPGTTGSVVNIAANTFTDSNTAGSGTAAAYTANALQRPTLVASNTLVTTTDAATQYIANSPLASTNETITNAWAHWVDAGACRYDGNVSIQGELVAGLNPWRFTATVAASAMTITLQNINGNTPSASSPVPISFRNATITTPQLTTVLVTGETTLVIPSTATMGTVNAVASRLWVGALNNAGTVELFAVNNVEAAAYGAFPQSFDGPHFERYREGDIISTTAISTGADSARVGYSTTSRTAAFRWLGYIESTQATAGTWATSPSRVQMYYTGIPLPGEVLQRFRQLETDVATGTTAVPNDNTTPLLTEGDQYISQAFAMKFAGNILHVRCAGNFSHSAASNVSMFIHDGTTVWAGSQVQVTSGGVPTPVICDFMSVYNSTGSSTWAMRAGSSTGSTTTFNGQTGAIRLNVISSFLEIEEIMV